MSETRGGDVKRRKGPNPYGPPTEKQIRLLHVLSQLIEERGGLAPTHREVMERAGLSNVKAVGEYIRALTRKGLVEFTPRSHRSISITEAGEYLLSGGALDYTPLETEEEEEAEAAAPAFAYPFVTLRAR